MIGVVARAAAPAMAPTSYGAARPAGRPVAFALFAGPEPIGRAGGVILPRHGSAGPGHLAPPAASRTADAGLSPLYGPLLAPPTAPDGCYVLGRIAQSLDGCIATASGASHWISGPEDIVHTHRLRALFDAVVIGAGTVRADDPQLTTREVGARRRCVLCSIPIAAWTRGIACSAMAGDAAAVCQRCRRQDRVGRRRAPVPRAREGLDIAAVLATLAERGLRRIFVEGGGITVSRFLAAGALDRLHVTVAPLLIGSGIPAFTLPQAATLTECCASTGQCIASAPTCWSISRWRAHDPAREDDCRARVLDHRAGPRRNSRGNTARQLPIGVSLVRMLATGVSRGTEALVFAGRVPPASTRRCGRR